MTSASEVLAVCPLAALRVEGARWAQDGVVVVRHRGELLAFEQACPHAGASLADGALHAGTVICPHHNARFRLRDGKVLAGSARRPLRCFEVEEVGAEVVVRPRSASVAGTGPLGRLVGLLRRGAPRRDR
jgi:nitrite reductase/ring-hydroxylating ferredoxin subunit